MTELEKNLDEVTNLALKTGEKVVTIDCPCCKKTFYALESEAVFTAAHPSDNPSASLSLEKLGRKCPFCGFSGGFTNGGKTKAELEVEKMKIEMEAEQMAYEAMEKRQTPWSQVCNQSLQFEDPKDD